jgi:lipopolysaccharide export system protein LptC
LQPGTGTGLGESLTKPNYVGTTDDGSAITIEAEMLEPSTSRPNFIEGEKVATRIETERGGIIDVSAISSEIDLARNNMTLIGDVTIVTSSGIFVETEKLMAKLDVTYAEATSQIDAQSPIGSLTAGSMTLKLKPDGTYVLDFKNGVNLLYEPKG